MDTSIVSSTSNSTKLLIKCTLNFLSLCFIVAINNAVTEQLKIVTPIYKYTNYYN